MFFSRRKSVSGASLIFFEPDFTHKGADTKNVELSMMGDKKRFKTCQGGDCKVFEERKVYNTTLTKRQRYNGIGAKAKPCFGPCQPHIIAR